jgi:hypothetical protein
MSLLRSIATPLIPSIRTGLVGIIGSVDPGFVLRLTD